MKLCICSVCSFAIAWTTAAAATLKHSPGDASLATKLSIGVPSSRSTTTLFSPHDNNKNVTNQFLALAHRHNTVERQASGQKVATNGLSIEYSTSYHGLSTEYSTTYRGLLCFLVVLIVVALALCLTNFGVAELATKRRPQNLLELFESHTIDFKLPDTVFGDAVLQFTICGSLHSAASQQRVSPPVAAWCRSMLCICLVASACFLQVFIAWNLDVKLAQERFGFREALDQCAKPLAKSCNHSSLTVDPRFWPMHDGDSTIVGYKPKTCCTKDQVCGEMSWKYFCTDKTIVKMLSKDPYGTNIWGSMACSFHKVSETYYEYEDTVYPRWQWLVSSVLFVWLCIMARDGRQNFLLLRAVTSRPRVDIASEQIVQDGKELEIVGMTHSTCVAVVILVVIPKFFICMYIAYVGSNLLVSTSGVMDLVLDGVALVFLIEVDQMLFYGLTGSVMRDVLRNSKPLSFRVNSMANRFIDFFGVDVSVIVVSFAIIMFIVFYVRSESKFMGEFIEAYCAP